jgi:choice-of-anchor A domain-containing protein
LPLFPMTSSRTFAMVVITALAGSGPAHAALVGDAANYNVFIFGSGAFTSQNTDTMGNLAAGGNVSLMNYSVAAGIAGNPAATPNPAQLVVGGTLTAQNGGVGSNQRGTIYTNSTPSLTSFTAAGVKAQTLVASFSADATLYTNLATSLSLLAANGTVGSAPGNTLNLTGTAAGLDVFTVAGSALTASQTINISVPTGATVLINVSGSAATLQNGSVVESGASASSLLYNFYQATSVNLAGSKDPEGSILAPDAGVTAGYGALHGQLVAASYSGNTQFDDVLFTGNLTPVPVPGALPLLLCGLGGLGALARGRRIASPIRLISGELLAQ